MTVASGTGPNGVSRPEGGAGRTRTSPSARSTSAPTSARWSLLVGLLSRGSALIVFAQHFSLQLLCFSSGRFAFEQPHEWVPPAFLRTSR